MIVAAAVTFGVLAVVGAAVTAAHVPWRRDAVPREAQLAVLADLPADQVARGLAFHAALRPPAYAATGLSLAITLALGFTGAGERIVGAVGDVFGGGWLAQATAGGLAVAFIGGAVTLPLRAWSRTVVRAYGLSTQSWRGWWLDLVKGYAGSAVVGAIVLGGFYGVARAAPRWWWALDALAAAALVVLLSYVVPVLFAPVFNRFTPMPDGDLRDRLLALVAAERAPVRDVLVADASRRTRAVNAYVTGLASTRRVVVYDTLLHEATPDEVVCVVAHELGHVTARDVPAATLAGALGAAAGVVGVYLLGSWRGLLGAAGVGSIADPRSAALVLAIAAVAGVLAAPVGNLMSRRVEARADAHALARTGDPATFEAMQARLALVNLAEVDPHPIAYALFATHPSTLRRIAAARATRPPGPVAPTP